MRKLMQERKEEEHYGREILVLQYRKPDQWLAKDDSTDATA